MPAAVGVFVTQLIAGIAGNSAFQNKIGQQVTTTVTAALGGGPLAIAVAPQVAAAVQSLLANDEAVEELSSVIRVSRARILWPERVVTALANGWSTDDRGSGRRSGVGIAGGGGRVAEPTRISQGRWASLWVMW